MWGATFVVIHDALREVAPLALVAMRFSLAALVAVPFALRERAQAGPAELLRKGAAVGVWLFVGYALQTVGLLDVAPARAAFLTGMYVVLVPPIQVFLYGRKTGPTTLAGVALAAVGLALLTGVHLGGATRGDLLMIGCAAAFAVQIVLVGTHAERCGPMRLATVEIAVVAALAWPAALVREGVPGVPSPRAALAIAACAVVATVLALAVQNWAQRSVPPARAAVLLSLEPVFAAAMSYAWTGERFAPVQAVGAALILLGMLAAEVPAIRRAVVD